MAWAAKIDSFDAYVFVTPEYNHSSSGALKNAIDFLYREWNNKVAGFVSYGSVGGARAVEHLRLVMSELSVATVRAQVALSLFTDFENFSVSAGSAAGTSGADDARPGDWVGCGAKAVSRAKARSAPFCLMGLEMRNPEAWPPLPLEAWKETYETLHMWTQIVGKIRLKLTPHLNHWWEAPFYLTSRGLTTAPIPFGDRTFDATFDFIDHVLRFQTAEGRTEMVALRPRSVADFYRDVMVTLQRLAIDVRIWTMPVEVPAPIRFTADHRHAAYEAAWAHRWWRILLRADAIFKEFRARFIGKASPVHFFWGSFDLAVTRFSGRRAPMPESADRITREGYSHEVSSCGFWPGSGTLTGPAFYSYAVPQPPGFKEAGIRPAPAFYSEEFSNFLLLYDDVRSVADPETMVLEFLQSTYEAAATLGRWDRENLESR